MEKGNKFSIYCSKTAFGKIMKQTVRSIQENTYLEHVEIKDKERQVYSEICRVKDKNSPGQRAIFTINTYRTKSSFLINMPKVQNFIQQILPGIQSWEQVNRTTIEMCNQQLKNMITKFNMEQNKVHLEEEKTKLTREVEEEEVKCDFRIEKKNKQEADRNR